MTAVIMIIVAVAGFIVMVVRIFVMAAALEGNLDDIGFPESNGLFERRYLFLEIVFPGDLPAVYLDLRRRDPRIRSVAVRHPQEGCLDRAAPVERIAIDRRRAPVPVVALRAEERYIAGR